MCVPFVGNGFAIILVFFLFVCFLFWLKQYFGASLTWYDELIGWLVVLGLAAL